MKKIIITGALGHIGSRVIRVLPEMFPSAEFVLIDNMLTQRFCSLFNLPKEGKFTFLEEDILKIDLEKTIAGADALIHLAAITDAAGSISNAAAVEETNFVGTKKVAEACAKAGVSMIFLSTTSVYGSQEKTVDENCPIDDLKPQSPYADSKLKAERLLTELGASADLSFVSLRFGTIFGTAPGMRFHTAVNKFIWQACNGKSITVWRTALDQTRPYLDLEDGVRAFEFILKRKLFDRQIYNVLTLNATVRQISDTIKSFVPDLKVELVDERIMNQLSYDVSRAKFEKLGFEFKGDLTRGVSDTVQLLRAIRQG